MTRRNDAAMLGSTLLALVRVRGDRLPLVAKVCNLIEGPNAGLWLDFLELEIARGLPKAENLDPNALGHLSELGFPATEEKLAKDCLLRGRQIHYRADSTIDFLPPQPSRERGYLDVLEVRREGMNLWEAVQRVVGIQPDAGALMVRLRSCAVTLPIIETILAKDASIPGLLVGRGNKNYFLVEDKRKDVGAIELFKDDHGCQVYYHPLQNLELERDDRIFMWKQS